MTNAAKIAVAVTIAVVIWIVTLGLIIGQPSESTDPPPSPVTEAPEPTEPEKVPEPTETPTPEPAEPKEPPSGDPLDAIFEDTLREAIQAEDEADRGQLCWFYGEFPDEALEVFKEELDGWRDSWDDIFHQVFQEECAKVA